MGVHDPEGRAWGDRAKGDRNFHIVRELIKLTHRELGSRIRQLIAHHVSVGTDFPQCGDPSGVLPFQDKTRDLVDEDLVVVVVGLRIQVVEALSDGLEARQRVRQEAEVLWGIQAVKSHIDGD